jgi:hypothetical protein
MEQPYRKRAANASPKRTRLERRPTQARRILNMLVAAYPGWVSLPELLNLRISQVSARIWELRHRHGYDILNETTPLPDGTRASRFRLVSEPRGKGQLG